MYDALMFMALLPVAILLIYMYYADRKSPEPLSQLFKAFFYGILCIPLTLILIIPIELIGLCDSGDPTTIPQAISSSFWGAAIPEEGSKLLFLWLLLRKNKYFDERLDGIVYAVFVSLGFAAVENIMYLIGNYDSFVSVGIARGVLSVPVHFSCGVLMGYFYSLTRFGNKKNKAMNRLMVLFAPIMLHGIYDTIAYSIGIISEGNILLLLFFFFFLIVFSIISLLVCYSRIVKLRKMDAEEPVVSEEVFMDKTNNYMPQPADCSNTQLPQELGTLLEDLSRNVHEVWAYERMKEGWSYGPQRNDIIKKHPCLVPYELLPESEKDYDRNTAIGTLKFIINSGYRIVKEEEEEQKQQESIGEEPCNEEPEEIDGRPCVEAEDAVEETKADGPDKEA